MSNDHASVQIHESAKRLNRNKRAPENTLKNVLYSFLGPRIFNLIYRYAYQVLQIKFLQAFYS